MAGLASFHEQPPLVFGIQALFFKLLGNSMYVERFYTFLTACITALLIVVFWKMIFKNDVKQKQLACDAGNYLDNYSRGFLVVFQ